MTLVKLFESRKAQFQKKWQFALSEFQRVRDQSLEQPHILQKVDIFEEDVKTQPPTLGWLVNPSQGQIFSIESDVSFFKVTDSGLKTVEANTLGSYRAQIFEDILRVDELSSGSQWTLHTNEKLRLGHQSWIVKLLPKKLRFIRSSSIILFLLGLGISSTAQFSFAEDTKSEIRIYQTLNQGGKIGVDLGLTHTNQGSTDFRIFSSSEKQLQTEQENLPVRLWVLVDVSTLCFPKKVATYINTVLPALGDHLHPDSKLSLATYSSHGNEIGLSHVSLTELKNAKVRCESQYLSSSFSSLLSALAQKEGESQLPTIVWVFSSGNVSLESQTQEWIQKLKLKVNVILYNPFLLEPVRATFGELAQSLGENYFQVSALDTETQLGIIPEVFYRLWIHTPLAFAGTEQRFKVIGLLKDQPIAEHFFHATAPERVYQHFVQKYSVWIALGLCCVLTGILIGFGFWYYRPITCLDCRRPIRRIQNNCLFCHVSKNGVLIESNQTVFPLKNGEIEIGLHRQSTVALLKKPGESRRCFFRIESVANTSNSEKQNQEAIFRLKRVAPQSLVQFTVNGERVMDERFLKNGDQIRVRNSEFVFYCWEENHEEMVGS